MILTLRDYIPIARNDGIPFNRAEIQESLFEDKDFVVISTISLLPLDVDPFDPSPRDFTFATTVNGGGYGGWYRVVFKDALGVATSPTSPVLNSVDLSLPYTPTVKDVGAILRARTKHSNGVEQGTFTSETRPTRQEAQTLIGDAAAEVQSQIGDISEIHVRAAQNVVALRAAMMIELSYFPESVGSPQSVYDRLEKLYDKQMANLLVDITGESEEGAEGHVGEGMPFYSFPGNAGGMVGWGTDM